MAVLAVESQLAESVGAAALGAVTRLAGPVVARVSAAAMVVSRLAVSLGAPERPVWQAPAAGRTAPALPLVVLPP